MRENRTSGVMREGVAGLNGPSPLLYRFFWVGGREFKIEN
jgi:hypothetical protein